jgi:hypothetical protein
MSPPQLNPIAPGLYEIGPFENGQVTFSYYLVANPIDPSPPPNLGQTWNDPDLSGWYLFLLRELSIEEAPIFAVQARLQLPALVTSPTLLNPRGIAWLARTTDWSTPAGYVSLYQLNPSAPERAPSRTFTLSWSGTFSGLGLGLQIGGSVSVALDTENAIIQFVTAPSDVGQIQLLYQGKQQQLYYVQYPNSGWNIDASLLGSSAGALCFDIALDYGQLSGQLNCGLTYSFPGPNGGSTLFYPVFPLTQPSLNTQKFLGCNVCLHPSLPTDPRRTALVLDLSGQNIYSQNSQKLASLSFCTTNGSTVTIVPAALGSPPSSAGGSPDIGGPLPPGFAFCKEPVDASPVTSPPGFQYYLAPIGTFQVAGVTPPQGSRELNEQGVPLMCGLSAQEFLYLDIGDLIEFVPDQPAWASGFSGAAGTQRSSVSAAEALETEFTTSWLKFPVGDYKGDRGYFAQPSASVYFAASAGKEFPAAVDSLLSDFPEPLCFPIVPYAGIVFPAGTSEAAGTYSAFESAILSTVRHSRIATNPAGPVFLPSGPLRTRLMLRSKATGDEMPSGPPVATTPQGLLAKLNPDGTWAEVLLALSPDNPSKLLSFGPSSGTKVVSPPLSNVLLQDQLFLVISLAAPLGQFSNLLSMAGFNFLLDVSPSSTILIFKYNTSSSLRDLVAQPSLWAETSTFIGGSPAAVEETQAAILKSIKTAADQSGASGDPFGRFNQLVDVPEWTGILALECAIDGNGMPPDLAMLLGGIPGQLRAHHLGIEANKISRNGELHLEQSSLFGVIYYQNLSGTGGGTNADFVYAVEMLSVVFANSKITQFAVQIGLTINRLFGRCVQLVSHGSSSPPPPPNTLVISGQYQSQDGIGLVTFASKTPFLYGFPTGAVEIGSPGFGSASLGSSRVLSQILIDQASLVPAGPTIVSSPNAASSPQLVQANFRLAGQLWFTREPFPDSDGVDLFSYGIFDSPAAGAPFSGLTVNMAFTLDSNGSTVPGSERLTLQPELFTLTPTGASIRPGSLLNSLPLALSRFIYSPQALNPSQLGVVPIHVLQLEGQNKAVSPPRAGGYPFVTTTPQFALEFDLPLGSLGSLSSVHAGLTAKLLLAWGPSQVVPDNDAAAVFVQLPQAMAGYGGFNLQGILQTTFGDANLLKVDLSHGPVYAILFNNIKLSVFGYSFPPGIMIDFTIFAGQPESGHAGNMSNIAWFLAAMQPSASPPKL